MRTLVVQSHASRAASGWLAQCLASVADWSAGNGFDYCWHGDEALQLTPDWYRTKLAGRAPMVADLARLLLIRDALRDGYQQVCWIDADVLLFAPDRLRLDFARTCAFGREYWVEADQRGRLQTRRNVHNAICVFRANCPVLPFLIHATMEIVRRVDPAHIAPQLVGPKLLGALHNIVGFDLIETVGAFSPAVVAELEPGSGASNRPALAMLGAQTPVPLAGANLCASVNGGRDLDTVCQALVKLQGLPV